jgi:hypothetical protein
MLAGKTDRQPRLFVAPEPVGCSFLVLEQFPDVAYIIVSKALTGVVVEASLSRAETAIGTMSSGFKVNGERVMYCKDVASIVELLSRLSTNGDRPPFFPYLQLDQAILTT